MSREELEKKLVRELQLICKENSIQYCTHSKKFSKSQMIDSILKMQEQQAEGKKLSTNEIVEKKIEDASVVAKEKEAAGKERYFENLKAGTLVAFREESRKLNTAAVKNVSYKRRQLKLVTQYGKEFIVPFEDVVWIRTKKRWPSFVLDELKGGKKDAVGQKGE